MAKCKVCGSSNLHREVLDVFHDDLLGIPVVVVKAVEREVCVGCGAVRGTLIPNLEGLIAAAAVKRVSIPSKLNGKEVRFLRKALGWKAKDLAAKLDVSPEHVSRWENEDIPISQTPEKFLRLVVYNKLKEKAPLVRCSSDDIVNMRILPVRSAESDKPLFFWLSRLSDQQNCESEEQWRTEKEAD